MSNKKQNLELLKELKQAADETMASLTLSKKEIEDELNKIPNKKLILFNELYDTYGSKHPLITELNADYFKEIIPFLRKVKNITFLEEYTRDEYGGEAHLIFHIENTNFYIKIEGWYSSAEGFEVSQYKFVNPIQKTITVYE